VNTFHLVPLVLFAVAGCGGSIGTARTSPPATLANGAAATVARLRLDQVP